MDFFILLAFKAIFDLLWPERKNFTPQETMNKSNNDTAAAFWFGTSFENLDSQQNVNPNDFSENSEYDL